MIVVRAAVGNVMTEDKFISYAQNFEDVMLWRVLKSVPNGYYIDVGANHPEWDSVTKAFYDRGWQGINVEADTSFHRLLCDERERDRNICTFVGAEEGEVEFYKIPDSGLSTFRKDFAEQHRESGWEVETIQTQVRTLTSILEEVGVNGQEIHFLKIDVEGAEESVLSGLDLKRYRPWILVIEATEPNSTKETHSEFEPIILAADYDFAYFDGLSRFYVAREKGELRKYFEVPPNVFDHFELRETRSALVRAETAEAKLDEGSFDIKTRERARERLGRAINNLESAVEQLYRSRRWRWGRVFSMRSIFKDTGKHQPIEGSFNRLKKCYEIEFPGGRQEAVQKFESDKVSTKSLSDNGC